MARQFPGPGAKPKVRVDTIGEAWTLLGHYRLAWALGILYLGIVYIAIDFSMNYAFTGSALGPYVQPDAPEPAGGHLLFTVIETLVWTAAASFLTGGLYEMALRHIRGEGVSAALAFSKIHLAPRVLAVSLLTMLAMTAGAVFLIIPGLVAGALFMLAIPLIVDSDMGVMEAMRASWRALKSDWINATVYFVVLGIVSFIGLLLCGIGFLFTYPLYFLGTVCVYRDFFLESVDPNPLEPLHDPA